ncbi:unnamed protein product, partial [Arctogadus glacialis]
MSGPQKVVLVTVGDRVGRGGPTRMASVLELLSSRRAEGEGSRSQVEGFVFLRTETHVLEALIQAQMKAVEGSKRIQRFPVNGSKPKALERDVPEMDPALRLMLQEKERAVMTLQETVE